MKLIYKRGIPVQYLFICIIILCLSSCAKTPVKVPVEHDRIQPEEPQPVEDKEDLVQPKISLIDILRAEAEKFFSYGKYKEALFIYDQALYQADDLEKPALISSIESVLEKTPPEDIEAINQYEDLNIPRPLLLYWLGLNYALENNPAKSKPALERFLSQYPDHLYYSDASDLLDGIKKALFDKYTIGCLLPMTGKYAIFGKRALSGIQLALKDLSEKYGKTFNVIVKDTQAKTDITIDAVRELHKKNVAAIMGPLLTAGPAGEEAQKLQIPLIALTQKNNFPFQGEYLFSNFITPEMQVQTLGAYLFKDLGIQKIAILYPDEKYGRKYMELFWDIVDEYGGEIVGVEPYDGRKTDFTVPIQKLTGQYYPVPEFLKPKEIDPEDHEEQKNDPNLESAQIETNIRGREKEEEKIEIDFQALFIPDSPSKVNLILPQLAFNDARGIYLVGTKLWHHKSILKDSKGYNKDVIITDGFFDNSQNTITAGFTAKFRHIFSQTPKFLEAVSYDTASMLFLTAMDENIDSRKALKDALQGSRMYEGVTGNTIFDKDGIAHKELFLLTIKNGKFMEISQ